ncbi:MAG TPA: hypothetical protein VFQ07_01820 [Candidatus Polarisedimenticolia bacterium]|nr:hypothetical protein [Candidatus Polarisedimenticolia bacterium]
MMKTVTILGLLTLIAAAPSGPNKIPPTTVITVSPAITGTVAFFPIFDIIRLQGGDLQSTCSFTTSENLEWQRAFAEFQLPVDPSRISRATLHVIEPSSGWSATPLPTDVHEVSLYPGDLVVDTSDYDVPVISVGTLETDANDDPVNRFFEFDVTRAIHRMHKTIVGMRIKLQVDPDQPCSEFQQAGSAFGEFYNYPPTLEIEFGAPKKNPKVEGPSDPVAPRVE